MALSADFGGLRPGDRKSYENGSVRHLFEDTRGIKGASFCVTALLKLQDSPLDMANYYCAGTTPWSMFDEYGVPSKVFYAFKAFNQLAQLPTRISCEGSPENGLTSARPCQRTKRPLDCCSAILIPSPNQFSFSPAMVLQSQLSSRTISSGCRDNFDPGHDGPFNAGAGLREEDPRLRGQFHPLHRTVIEKSHRPPAGG